MTRKGGSAAPGHLPSTQAAPGQHGTGAKLATSLRSCRFLPPVPSPPPQPPLANPSLQGNASQTYSQGGDKPCPIAQWEGASCSVSHAPWIAEGLPLLPYPEKALLRILGF